MNLLQRFANVPFFSFWIGQVEDIRDSIERGDLRKMSDDGQM